MAKALESLGALDRWLTADLRGSNAAIRSKLLRFPLAFWGYTAGRLPPLSRANPAMWQLYDYWVARQLRRSCPHAPNVFHGWNSFCLKSVAEARRNGIVAIVERSGSHVDVQRAILREETELLGAKERLDQGGYFSIAAEMKAEYDSADYIMTCSEWARASFLRAGYSPEKVKCIYLGSNFTPRSRPCAVPPKFRLVCVGTNGYRKGIVYLLKAWNKLRLPAAELIICCPVPELAKPLLNQNSITVLPPMPRSRLEEHYALASAFCLPSIEDGFGMVVLEAMAFGLPVILSSHVGAAELLRDGHDGLRFPVRDVEALAACIERLYCAPDEAAAIGRAGQELAQKFTWERFGAAMVEFYTAALN
jgi:glycosyltransferase involved in cell wall biosynthesis